MRPAWEGCDVTYATTHSDYVKDIAEDTDAGSIRFRTFPDANRWGKVRLLRQVLAIFVIIIREKPDVVVSTGASAGYFALRIAKFFRRRTIWVDSIANAEELSQAGRLVRPYADLWLTQWPHVADEMGRPSPRYLGGVL